MVVQASLPGATVEETLHQLTDRIEKKLQETPSLDYLKSYTVAGRTTVFVNLRGSVEKSAVPGIWYQVRKKIGDIQFEFPEGTLAPFFNDEFGDTFGIIYAFTSDGFSHRELKDYVESARGALLRVPDVAKIETLGAQDERVYVEFSTAQMAKLGVDPSALVAALQRQNALTPSGAIDTGRELVRVETTGKFGAEDELRNLTLYVGAKKIRLGDVATITRTYADPPQPLFRVNGKDAIGLAISMRSGGDILELEKNIQAEMERLHSEMPVGIEANLVADQPKVVHDAVRDFMEALAEAVAIVLAISFLSLGMRAGTVVALSIPLVLAVVFVGMQLWGIDLQRISLGALIISLGLLVDDAMITVESMVAKLEEGWDAIRSASFAYVSTAFPMLTGTLVTIIGFVPIGFAKSEAGEYTFSLFAVVSLALLVSWFVAVLFSPLLGVGLLKQKPARAEHSQGRVLGGFRKFLLYAMGRPKITVIATLGAFLLALAALPLVPDQFFPSSERPELVVNLSIRQGSSIHASDAISKKLDAVLKADPDIDHWSSYVGRGAVRFYLPLDEQLHNDFFSQTIVVTKSAQARERVHQRLRKTLAEQFPEAVTGIFALELGPPVGWPVQYRVSGPEPAQVNQIARKLAQTLGSSPALEMINFDWGEPARKLRINVNQEEARKLGLTSASIAQTINTAFSGATATQIRDSIYLVDVVLRAKPEERLSLESLRTLGVPLASGSSVPLEVVARVDYAQDFPLVWRRDRAPTLTVQAKARESLLPAAAVASLQPKIDELANRLPRGYKISVGGSVEESDKSQQSVAEIIPVMLLLMVTVLMIQLQDFKSLLLVLSSAPLGLIGVVFALLMTRQPLGFVALLGIVALIGMIVRNSVILVTQIKIEQQRGLSDWDAIVEASSVRFRPIMLTAVAAILGMVPIAPTVFWGPMATAIMGGLAVATLLTLVFLPALYVWCYRVRVPQNPG
jgi:multidrug efflux pump subunit AcrB